MKTYTFHVSLPGTGRVWRKIEMRADQTLEELHRAIQHAYDWDGDHLYSFFMSGKAWDGSSEYCLPEGYTPWGDPVDGEEDDEEEVELTPEEHEQDLRMLFGDGMTVAEMEASMEEFWTEFLEEEAASGPGNVQTTTLEDLDLKPMQEFMYLFDYGDEWRFKVRVHIVNQDAGPDAEVPRLVESVGEAPPQVPEWDEEEDWEDEDWEDEDWAES
jgi:hypothetical protein